MSSALRPAGAGRRARAALAAAAALLALCPLAADAANAPRQSNPPPSFLARPARARLLEVPKRAHKSFTFYSGPHEATVSKRPQETMRHVLMKVLLWSLNVNDYSDLRVEAPIGDRYTPDCVALEPPDSASVAFWGECGRVDMAKVASLAARYPQARLAFCKWDINPAGFAAQVAGVVAAPRRASGLEPEAFGPVEVLAFPEDSDLRFFTRAEQSSGPEAYEVRVDPGAVHTLQVWPPP